MDSYATIKILNQLQGRNEFLVIVNQTDPDCSARIGATIVGHLRNVISRFIDINQEKPVRVELIGTIPIDPAIPQAIRQRQLLFEICPDAPAACLMNNLADLLHARMA
jgi:flagellar biosynthesis protein FlhG